MTEFTCQYCNKRFTKDSTFNSHICEAKRRHSEKHERGVQIGYQAFLRFYEITQGSAKLKTHDDFIKSPYYRAFVKFGKHVIGIRAVNPMAFAEWLLKNNKKIDYWTKDVFYEEFLAQYLKAESIDSALSRALEYSIDWANQHCMQSQDVLRYGNSNALVYAVTTGRISPWVLYNCESGQKFLDTLHQEHLRLAMPWLDPEFWQKKFHDLPADKEYMKEMLSRAGW